MLKQFFDKQLMQGDAVSHSTKKMSFITARQEAVKKALFANDENYAEDKVATIFAYGGDDGQRLSGPQRETRLMQLRGLVEVLAPTVAGDTPKKSEENATQDDKKGAVEDKETGEEVPEGVVEKAVTLWREHMSEMVENGEKKSDKNFPWHFSLRKLTTASANADNATKTVVISDAAPDSSKKAKNSHYKASEDSVVGAFAVGINFADSKKTSAKKRRRTLGNQKRHVSSDTKAALRARNNFFCQELCSVTWRIGQYTDAVNNSRFFCWWAVYRHRCF